MKTCFSGDTQPEHVDLKNWERVKQAPVAWVFSYTGIFWAQLCHTFDILSWSSPEVASTIPSECLLKYKVGIYIMISEMVAYFWLYIFRRACPPASKREMGLIMTGLGRGLIFTGDSTDYF